MNSLETEILTFNNWSQPWTFVNYISESETLSDSDKLYFQQVWKTALDNSTWIDADLSSCSELTIDRLKTLFPLNEEAIKALVRAASYDWK